jgi:hypothetical protein
MELPPAAKMHTIKVWLEEMCKLLKQGGHLQALEVHLDNHRHSQIHAELAALDVEKYQKLLEPLKRLKGLKSAVVEGKVTKAYSAELKESMEGGVAARR